jgi:hypothetical protein
VLGEEVMVVSISLLLYVLAVVCFGLAFLNVPRFNWVAGGLGLVTLATFVI